MKDYVLSAKAILYAAKKAGAQSFTGLPNALYGIDKAAEAKIIREAEDELTEAGLMELDFDGKSTIEKELLNMVLICSNVSQITGYDLKLADGNIKTATVFLDRNDNYYLLTGFGQEDEKYLFAKKSVDEIKKFIKEYISVPEGTAEESVTVVESSLLSGPEKETLVEAGSSEDTADLIEKAINGGACALSMRRFINTVEDQTIIYYWNDSHILNMNVVYEDDKENVHFAEATGEKAYSSMFGLLDRPEFEDEEEPDISADNMGPMENEE